MTEEQTAHIGDHALQRPDHVAVVLSDGSAALTYGELDARSDAMAGQFAAQGLAAGDHIAILMGNEPDFLVAAWAAQRSGLYYTPVNWHLTAGEAAYIIADCGARAVVFSDATAALLDQMELPQSVQRWRNGRGGASGFSQIDHAPAKPQQYASLEGSAMLYSSGTSGKPKGIKRTLSGSAFGVLTPGDTMLRGLYGWSRDTIFLCPSPLYHAAPMNFAMATHRAGGTVVVMPQFEPVEALQAIAQFGVNRIWFVPTMMIRLLKLPDKERAGYDISSVTHIVHSGAPCPPKVKHAMLEWWGPVLYEFYAATEGNGFVAITPREWLDHPGSVGRSDDVRIVGEDGSLVPQGEIGLIYFASEWTRFAYHNDAEKTAEAHDSHGWTTLGDMGYLDADGYLYLADRKSHMIISGGVNIYPQEAENVLALHPRVLDVAVIGVPNEEYGEEVKAVVQLVADAAPSEELEAALIAFCRDRLARYKCPRSVDFVDELPRLPTGKLRKRDLRARYWNDARVRV